MSELFKVYLGIVIQLFHFVGVIGGLMYFRKVMNYLRRSIK
jgi:hypothetical protein